MKDATKKTSIKLAFIWLVLGAILCGYYWYYRTTMPSSYFWMASGALVAGAILKWFLFWQADKYSAKSSKFVKTMDLLVDAFLVAALIVMFMQMQAR